MLSFDQMEEAIKVVEQHLTDCQINQDFKQADIIKQRVLQLKSIRDLIEREDIMIKSKEQSNQIEKEFNRQIEEIKTQYGHMMERFYEQKCQAFDQLRQNQRKETQKLTMYRKQPNAQYLNLQRIMNYLSNQKNFKKAEQYQIYMKELEQEQMKKSHAEQRMSADQQQKNLRSKHCQQEETMMGKFNDQEVKLKIDLERKVIELEQKRANQLKQIQQDRVGKIGDLEKRKTKSLKVQIQSQLNELEYLKC